MSLFKELFMAIFPLFRANDPPTLLYLQEGRSGKVIYRDHQGDISFYFEFGGGDCVAVITIPTEDKWTAETGRSADERQKILEFVTERATRDQTHEGSWRTGDEWIEIYSRTEEST